MRITQGTFSFLPDLSDQQIRRQISYAVERGWAISVEHTDDPHPRNVYWEMWGHPLFDLRDVGEAMRQVQTCRADRRAGAPDRKSTRLNSSHVEISYAVFCLKKKKKTQKEYQLVWPIKRRA